MEITYTNKNGYPFYIYEWLKRDDYDYEADVLTATTLISPIRQTVLLKKYASSISIDVSERIPTRLGTLIHESFERMKFGSLPEELREHREVEQEKRVYAEVEGQKISGKFDMLISDQAKKKWKLIDVKTTSVWNFIYQSRKDDYTAQLSILSFILKENGYEIEDDAEIIYFFTDWKRSDSISQKDYPKDRIVLGTVRLWDYEYTKEWIRRRVNEINKELTKDTISVECTDEELWKEPDRYAIKKKGKKRASKIFDNLKDAEEYVKSRVEERLVIEKRAGTPRRCQYCIARSVCGQYERMKMLYECVENVKY